MPERLDRQALLAATEYHMSVNALVILAVDSLMQSISERDHKLAMAFYLLAGRDPAPMDSEVCKTAKLPAILGSREAN
jgi:hypothetical protein